VDEETGIRATLGRELLPTRYQDRKGRPKVVRYWEMTVAAHRPFEPNAEVDELRWLPLGAAAELCSHEPDREVLADLARTDVPLLPTLILVRHARAGDRAEWDGPDDLRPLDDRGRAQARRLADVLPVFGPVELLSAPPLRCVQTIEPLAERTGLDIRPAPEIGEEGFAADPEAALALVERLLAPTDRPGVTVVCSQGGAIPSVLEHLGVRPRGARVQPPSAKGSCWVLGGRAGALSADYYRDLDPDPDAPGRR
jgi:8-oxo-dGTP diphosphatase